MFSWSNVVQPFWKRFFLFLFLTFFSWLVDERRFSLMFSSSSTTFASSCYFNEFLFICFLVVFCFFEVFSCLFSDSVRVGCKLWCRLIISIIARKLLFDFNAMEALFCDTGDWSLFDRLSWIVNWLEDFPQSGFFEEFLLCFLQLLISSLMSIINPGYFYPWLFTRILLFVYRVSSGCAIFW